MSDGSRIEQRKEEHADDETDSYLGTVLAVAGILVVLAIVVYVIVVGSTGGPSSLANVDVGAWSDTVDDERVEPGEGEHPSLVSTTANASDRITVTYYGDFQCPHCASFERQHLPRLIEEYVAPGDVRFVFRPVNVQAGAENGWARNAENAALGSSCVWRANRSAYWSWHHAVFEGQSSQSREWASPSAIADVADRAGVSDPGGLEDCIENERHAAVYDDNNRAHADQPVPRPATPLFAVAGDEVVEGNDYAGLSAAIDRALASRSGDADRDGSTNESGAPAPDTADA